MEIDLTGPQGNAFVLLGIAQKLAKQLNKNGDAIIAKMKEKDYDHLIQVFEENFGDCVILYK